MIDDLAELDELDEYDRLLLRGDGDLLLFLPRDDEDEGERLRRGLLLWELSLSLDTEDCDGLLFLPSSFFIMISKSFCFSSSLISESEEEEDEL